MKTLTRTKLYEKIWTTPITRLSKEFGISDVGLAKTCTKYDIPRPPRGYWARIAAGYQDKQTPLPKADDVTIEFDVEANKRRRSAIKKQQEFESQQAEAFKPVIEQAKNMTHPLAERFLKFIEKEKPDQNGLVTMKRLKLPEIEIAAEAIPRVVEFLSLIAFALAEHKVKIGKNLSNDTLLFERDDFGVGLKISQALIKGEREPTLEQKKNPSWTWNLTTYTPSEKLVVVLHSANRIYGTKKWTESNANSITDLAPKIATRIESLLAGYEQERLNEIQREKDRAAQEIRAEKNRRIQRRLKHIEGVKAGRARELIRASMLWKEYQQVTEFINECELRWSEARSPKQQEWLNWAKEVADSISPFNSGYPNPDKHGVFDESTVEEDGYYSDEAAFIQKTQLIKDIQKLTEKRGYGYSSW
ncbi:MULTISPECIES: hypothetical protein [unclassified Lentimonas]|uniref:hypothetical protein n=1 Tax=unclassified Lentimonas TaxID=2630993 RepID=UPI001322583F|nr:MULTISPECIES: hypothetical protein [unclassified Lentimonas]CAA6677362.1 Unannotated [Lentimonas sp. CC4]CAA6686907.1 Unannotated [Lentimonas sp. CC6]CAA6690090.1 Unannotated [Lentimonas sp. CC19]CAA6690953.1 Unannotated [Lentimonas sp. CC10]CAA7070700.1 Unannotated [Lentimonas sp. CC11]